MPAVLDALSAVRPLLVDGFWCHDLCCLVLFKAVRPALTVVMVVGTAMVWLIGLMVTQGWKVEPLQPGEYSADYRNGTGQYSHGASIA